MMRYTHDTDDANVHPVHAAVVHKQGLRASFTFVVAGADAHGIDVSPVGFRLGMDHGISVYFAGGGLEDSGFAPFGEAQHIQSSQHGGFHCVDGVKLIMGRRGGAGQVVDLVNFHDIGNGNVMAYYFKSGIIRQV